MLRTVIISTAVGAGVGALLYWGQPGWSPWTGWLAHWLGF